ncbi:MAG: glutamate-ammonia-ligase adenylyltransferase, partial [Acetobacteraceae bacterium]|nr:glutamate-ammonia-ligase adenylyltransferase [Acetobacteraceae bacterium]
MSVPQPPSPSWPQAADPEAAGRLIGRFAALGERHAALAGSGEGGRLLAALGGNSPYLADLAIREADTLLRVVEFGADGVVADALAAIAALPQPSPRPLLAAVLREAKRRVALAVAVADIGGRWTLEQVTAALSDLAETALHAAVAHLLLAGHDAGELRL